MTEATPRQLEIFIYIKSYITEHGIAPTFTTVGSAIGISHTAVRQHVDLLEKKGYLLHLKFIPQSIKILK
jgi:SOS-response transcriptional repressor LexA